MKKLIALALFVSLLVLGLTRKHHVENPEPTPIAAVIEQPHESSELPVKPPQILLPRFNEPLEVRNPEDRPAPREVPKDWNGPRPKSVAEIPADVMQKVREVYNDDLGVELLNYQLGFLDRLDKCVGSQIAGRGEITLHLVFDVANGEAAAGAIDVRESSLSEAEDIIALDCIRKSHNGTMKFRDQLPEDRPEFHWATQLSFPVKNDTVYPFIFQQS